MGTRIFVGGLAERVTVKELEEEFEYYGRVRDVWVARNPPGFGFMIFEEARDAQDAIKDMDGRKIAGSTIRVELAKARDSRSGGGGRGGGGGGQRRGGGISDMKCYNCNEYGHLARDCRGSRGGYGGGGGGGGRRRSRSRSRSRSPRRSRRSPSRSRSRSPIRSRRDRSLTPRRSHSPAKRSISRSRSRSRSHHSHHSRSPSPH